MTLNNLGNLRRVQNRMDDARQAYQEVLKTYRELARKNPETYLPDVAMTLNNLGILHSDQNRMDDARQAYEEALKTYRELARNKPRDLSARCGDDAEQPGQSAPRPEPDGRRPAKPTRRRLRPTASWPGKTPRLTCLMWRRR